MSRPLAPSTSLMAVSAATTPSNPGLNSVTGLSVGTPDQWSCCAHRVACVEGRSTRVLVAVPIVVVVVVDALYLAIVVNQDPRPPELFTLPFIAGYLALV